MDSKDNIDWNFSDDEKPSWSGEYDGHISFYKETGFYAIKFNNGSPDEILKADGLSFGLKKDEVYITTDKVLQAPHFKLRTHKNGYKIITRKKLVTDIVNQILDKVPKDKASIQFNIKHCSENIWRIIDVKLI